MSGNGLLVEPQGYKAKGVVPRKAVFGMLGAVLVVVIAWWWFTSDVQQTKLPDQAAVEAISAPDRVQSLPAGNPQSVDESAEAAQREVAAEAKRRQEEQKDAQAAGLPAMPGGAASAPVPSTVLAQAKPLPAADIGQPSAPSDRGSVEAAQEVTRRNAPATVFEAEPESQGAQPLSRLLSTATDAALQQVSGTGAPSTSGDLARQLTEMTTKVLQAQQPSAAAPQSGDPQQAWSERMASPRKAPDVLQPAPAAAPLLLVQGSVIPAVTTRPINSDQPGVVTARVLMDVYDSQTARKLLIPKGALLIGAYNSAVANGQSRLQFAFTQLRMPDNATYELPGAIGSDQAGNAGIEGDLNRHLFARFGSALMVGWLADRMTRQSAMPQGGVIAGGGLSATGQAFLETARSLIDRYRGIPDTITVPAASRITVEVQRDMAFPSVYTGPRF
jgi:type IV secretion system protein VirB10